MVRETWDDELSNIQGKSGRNHMRGCKKLDWVGGLSLSGTMLNVQANLQQNGLVRSVQSKSNSKT